MALLAAYKIEKTFGGRTLFADVSFEIAQKDHIGLVGANGTGKTTLIEILQGLQSSDSGDVYRAKLLKIGFLEQAPALEQGQTLYELTLAVFAPLVKLERELEEINTALLHEQGDPVALSLRQATVREKFEAEGGLVYKSHTRSALLGLGFTEAELLLPAHALSGGQLNKAMLARVLLSGADLLFLDEPTNHLDILAVEWLENYLKSYAGAYLIISHDRYFLDQVTNRTFELKNERLIQSKGNYSAHVALCSTEQEIARRHYYNTQKEIKRIYGIVEQQRRWNRERNIRTAESKLKQIDRLKATLVEPKKEQQSIRFSFHVRQPGGNDVLIAENLKKAYGDNLLFSNANLTIRKGERVCLLGPNGCGKTTLLRVLMGKETADTGTYYLGAGVEAAYYEQNMRSMNPGFSVLQEVRNAYPRMHETELRNALAAFLFRGGDVEKKIEMLSGGEKARVQLLKL
ncbi:ATP-binding cassette domain-containing protein, partial [Christensenellaceae bacterium OttesenSCG-928-L17]|nr:ATP-binding cassette domain-containing protein [Christensenellaceae bacterium OttesenSCG-928-L17]